MELKYSTAWILAASRIARLELGFVLLLVAFQALSPCTASVARESPIGKKYGTPIDYSLYHHRDDLLQEVEALAIRHPDCIKVETLKSQVDGYASETVVATVEHGGKSSMEDKYRVLLSFGQHSRELITCEVALRLLGILVGEGSLTILNNETIKQQFKRLIIKVIPMENYNGRAIVESGSLCERKNGRGVDINRNWSVDWGKKEEDFDPTEEFPGGAPFSEPETRVMRDLAKSFKPHLWINVHSGMQAMFMPYDYKKALPDPRVAEVMKQFLQMLNRLHCNNSCVIGPGGGSVGYLAHGTATDYMYEALMVPLAFTFEIYGDPKALDEDCFGMFNPTNATLFESTIVNWCMAFITIFIECETVFKSLPSMASIWRDKGYNSTVSSTSRNSAVSIESRENLQKRKRAQDMEYRHEGKHELANETMRLFEFIIILSISCLVFIWYVYLRGYRPLLARYEARLPLRLGNHFQIDNSS